MPFKGATNSACYWTGAQVLQGLKIFVERKTEEKERNKNVKIVDGCDILGFVVLNY